jgi:translation initiation factor 1A
MAIPKQKESMKRGGKQKGRKSRKQASRNTSELIYKDDGQEYAQILRKLGGPNIELACADGVTRMGIIRGTMRNKVWLNTGDYVLVGLRDFQDNKCDIILRYTAEQVRTLKAYKEIPEQEQEEDQNVPLDFDDI